MKYLALDLGGSSMKTAIIDENYNFLQKKRYLLSGTGYGREVKNAQDITLPTVATAQDFALQIKRLCEQINEPLGGLAVSYCCPVNHKTGQTFVGGEAYGYLNEINLKALLEEHCKLPVAIEKDSNCMLRAEVERGSLKGCDNAIALGLGTGIACGILLNGAILRGAHYAVGEASNILVEHSAEPTLNDRLMVHCGVSWLMREFARCKQTDIALVNGEVVFSLINSGDAQAVFVLESYAKKIAVQIYNLQLLLDVEAFSIGGGISCEGLLIEAIQRAVLSLHNRLKLCNSIPVVRQGKFYNDANLIGAALNLRRSERRG